ncbi:MAG: 5-formyltetrahydrofolate cyclo-ligase [Pseudomonadota bacterium]
MPSEKETLRHAMKARRERLAKDNTDAAEIIAARFPEKLLDRFGPLVSGYLPIGSEVDIRPLLARLATAGAELVLPRIDADNTMSFRAWLRTDQLETGPFSLQQPERHAAFVRPTLVLLPLLAFDRSGNRLGYGKGHYDRALAELRRHGRVFTCGIAFADQQVEQLPAEPHDIPLDWVVTENGSLPLFLQRATSH